MKESEYDLEERLGRFAADVIKLTEALPRSRPGTYIADQLLRSGTSPYGIHGEAEGAESRDDFIHKLKICYKELRESRRWLRLVSAVPLLPNPGLTTPLLGEADELVRIFSASLRTAERNRPGKRE